jgi:hypothetical protein
VKRAPKPWRAAKRHRRAIAQDAELSPEEQAALKPAIIQAAMALRGLSRPHKRYVVQIVAASIGGLVTFQPET